MGNNWNVEKMYWRFKDFSSAEPLGTKVDSPGEPWGPWAFSFKLIDRV